MPSPSQSRPPQIPPEIQAQIDHYRDLCATEERRGQFHTVHHATLAQILASLTPTQTTPQLVSDDEKE